MADTPAGASPDVELQVRSAAEMHELGERLGRMLRAGDVLALIGPLGSGKTTLAQGLAAGLGVPAERHVSSPTFALVNQHPGRVPFVHADLYRVRDPAELPELGLDEAYDGCATAIEWADRFPDALPADRLELSFEVVEGGRRVRVHPTGERSRAVAAGLRG
jgi:tRNA threonylcarbamoyladenosine biosynthesis protein TsaE